MTHYSRPAIIVGNWKMYKTISETKKFVEQLIPLVAESVPAVFLAVPFTAIAAAAEAADGSEVAIGAQNMNDASEGAFTGEIAAPMLLEAGAKFVILGHSERRHLFHEDDQYINRKVVKALDEGLIPIVCVGETDEQRESGSAEAIIKSQITHSLDGLKREHFPNTLIAYEPIWAIGTGKTATAEIAQETHKMIRTFVEELWGSEAAAKVSILYGGSVKPANAKELMEQSDIDGLLVGGASLTVESFSKIVNYQNDLIQNHIHDSV